VGATATFAELHASLALIWNRSAPVKPADWRMSLGRLVRVRLMSVGLIMGIGFLLLVLLVFDAASTAAYEWFLGHDSPLDYGLLALQRLASWAALSFIFAVLLRYLSDARPRWREVIPGAALGALLFTIGKRLFGLYLARAGTADAFGAAGSLAVVLMWLFYSAAVFLFGAQYAARSRLEQPALI
jgi:membrane protein